MELNGETRPQPSPHGRARVWRRAQFTRGRARQPERILGRGSVLVRQDDHTITGTDAAEGGVPSAEPMAREWPASSHRPMPRRRPAPRTNQEQAEPRGRPRRGCRRHPEAVRVGDRGRAERRPRDRDCERRERPAGKGDLRGAHPHGEPEARRAAGHGQLMRLEPTWRLW